MKRISRISVPLIAVVLLGGSWLLATDEIATQNDLKCTACHDKAGSKLLTDKGLYYETTGSLEGFDKLTESFGKCTKCHVRKPGSEKLTKTGKQVSDVAGDMSELRDWLKKGPELPTE